MILSPRLEVLLASETCCTCGLLFAMPGELMAQRREDLKTFYCPNGHPQTYAKSEADRLLEQLATKQEAFDRMTKRASDNWAQVEQEQRRSRALRGVISRLKKARG